MSTAKLFDLVCEGYLRATVSAKVRRLRWEENLNKHAGLAPSKLIRDQRYRLSHHGANLWAEGFQCPACGAKRRTAAGTPSCKLVAGTYGLANNPGRLSCGACGQWSASSSELVRLLHPAPTQRLTYLEQNCKGAEPKMRLFTAARSEGSASLRTETIAAIRAALPVEHDGTIELCRISAIDEAQALEVMQLVPEDAWVKIPITIEGEPRVLSWHQQPPTIDEIAAYERVKVREDKKKRASIEKEIRAFREERLHGAGLSVR
jgi:hypothetical protein